MAECYASKVIEIALGEVGYLEKKSNKNLDDKTANAGYNNYNKYAKMLDDLGYFYNGRKNGYQWCDCFVYAVFVMAYGVDEALKLLCQPKKSYGAGCVYSKRYYQNKGQLYTKNPKPGDQIFFWNAAKTAASHTGLVYAVDKTYVYTVEGNTSGASGVIANGGGVCKKKYRLTYSRIAGYGRPAYDPEPQNGDDSNIPKTYVPTVKEWQLAAIADGFSFPKYGADGVWGAECASVAEIAVCKVRNFYAYPNLTRLVQKSVGVDVDGKFGKNTKSAVISYQRRNGLADDGEVGINTWKKILAV